MSGPCLVCGRPVDPRTAVGVGMPPRPVHAAVCFDTWLGQRLDPIRAALRGDPPDPEAA